MTWAELKRASENRVRWRSMVAALCSPAEQEDWTELILNTDNSILTPGNQFSDMMNVMRIKNNFIQNMSHHLSSFCKRKIFYNMHLRWQFDTQRKYVGNITRTFFTVFGNQTTGRNEVRLTAYPIVDAGRLYSCPPIVKNLPIAILYE